MIQRTSAYITIKRPAAIQDATVVSVPITEKSVRKYMLMQDDYIQLSFSLGEAVHIAIGDYCEDELFGKFIVTEEQMPKYNTATGGYDYTLRLDKDYMLGKNKVHCLIADGQRMESEWSLTDHLSVHAQQVADGMNIAMASIYHVATTASDTDRSTGYAIEVDADNASEVKFLSYDGKNFIESMNMIAEKWQCEWWITDERKTVDGVRYDHTIHFGKCEQDNTAYDFVLGDNVESMDVSRDQQDYYNRIYAYGGTQNVPEDYDRELVFECTDKDGTNFKDSSRPLSLAMIEGDGNVEVTHIDSFGSVTSTTNGNTKTRTQVTSSASLSGTQTLGGIIYSRLEIENDDWAATDTPTVTPSIKVYYGTNSVTLTATTINNGSAGMGYKVWEVQATPTNVLELGSTAVSVYIEVKWTIVFASGSFHTNDTINMESESTMTATASTAAATKDLTLTFNGNDYSVRYSGSTTMLSFLVTTPSGFGVGSKYTLSPLTIEVPLYYYTPVYNTGTMSKVGEKRIHLPLADYPNRYIELAAQADKSQVVEGVVIFDDVYPKLELKVSQITTQQMTQRVEHSDDDKWIQYKFRVTKADDSAFSFSTKYLLDGAKLQAAFTAPSTVQNSGYMLGGMTFDVDFVSGDWFKIIRNEEYGAKLPNDILKPSVGDTLFLTGWNPKAISNGLGLVEDAEEEVADKAEAYLQALKEGQFTFGCKMMSEYAAQAEGSNNLLDKNGKTLVTSDGYTLALPTDYTSFSILQAGTKVNVHHDALPTVGINGENVNVKQSRIIGYECNLDLPFDTPTYTVGETDAFSRLKRIEKELTKLR